MEPTIDVFSADDGYPLRRFRWTPAGTPRGTVQVLHGLAEHAGRYQGLADVLTADGWAVVAHDHRGHGESVRTEADRGHFADDDGWTRALLDVDLVAAAARKAIPERPLVLLGHSMGSSLALHTFSRRGDRYSGVVLSGPTGVVGALRVPGLVVARIERFRLGRRGHSALLQKLSFGDFNRAFEPARTEFDWLSRDAVEVDRYIADPHCGFMPTTQHWCDHLVALGAFGEPGFYATMPQEVPVHIIAGTQDPVSKGTAQIPALLEGLRSMGNHQVTTTFWPAGRHESFNETNRAEVFSDLTSWLHTHFGKA